MSSGRTWRSSWLWIGVGGFIGLLAGVAGIGYLALSDGAPGAPMATSVLTVIPYPSLTPTLTPSPTSVPTEAPTASATPPAEGDIALGQLVTITGTGGDGLRLRASAGLGGDVRFVALENEVFEVSGGPVQADGYTWWLLLNPYDESQTGWGVANYLRGQSSP